MKSGLPARKERAAAARRMGGTLHEMATANHTDDAVIFSALDKALSYVIVAGGGTGVLLWRGAEFTLGHLLVIVAGVAALGTLLWRRFRSGPRTS